MSVQKIGPIILATTFILAALFFVAFWIVETNEIDTVRANLASARTERTNVLANVRKLRDETATLRQMIGRHENMATWISSPEVTGGAQAGAHLDEALQLSLDARDAQASAAVGTQISVNEKIAELQETIQAKDGQILATRERIARAEQNLLEREEQHSEKLRTVAADFDEIRQNLQNLQEEFEEHKDNHSREVEARESDIRDKRAALVQMRTRIFEREDLSFEVPDGVVRNLDQVRGLAFINLGSDDSLPVGTRFSVYDSGRGDIEGRNTEDVKGEIEVVDVLGPGLAKCRIREQDRPFANGDLIYNPAFTSGLQPEVLLAGRLEGVDRARLLRMIAASGSKVIVQLTDDGEFVDGANRPLSREQAEKSISDRTRFLVIAHLADADEKVDADLQSTFERIEENTDWLRDAALEHGVYEIGLSNFLEYIGYSQQPTRQQ